MNARDILTELVDAFGRDRDSARIPSTCDLAVAIHTARNFLAVPDRLLACTVAEMVVRLDTQHPSRRGVKRNASALDMLAGAAIAAHHSGNEAGYNMFAHLAIMVATRGADELNQFLEAKK